MKRVSIFFLLAFLAAEVTAQDLSKFKAYNPSDDAEKSIAAAVKEAKENNKHVFIQVGGNWCIWCLRFDNFIRDDKQLDSLMSANFVIYHLNYSGDNYNSKLLAKYSFPQRFGFPVFLILNGDGELIHTQNSTYLEKTKEKTYNKEYVSMFLNEWGPKALDPAQYKEQ